MERESLIEELAGELRQLWASHQGYYMHPAIYHALIYIVRHLPEGEQ